MNERVCNRLTLSKTLLLEFANGDILQGRTRDISPRGVLFTPDRPPADASPGMAGTLFMISDEGHFSIGYPCQVVRVSDDSIALALDKKAAAAFGNYLTRELLKRQL